MLAIGLLLFLSAGLPSPAAVPAHAASVVRESGVALPTSIALDGRQLSLSACGTRDVLWADIFVAALYFPARAGAAAMGDPDRAKAVRLTVSNGALLPGTIPEKYREALSGVLDPGQLRAIEDRFARLAHGDTLWLTYVPRAGVSLSLNGDSLLAVPDHRAVDAILNAWGADKPWPEKMREVLSDHSC